MPQTLEQKLQLEPGAKVFLLNPPKSAPPVQAVAKKIDLADAVIVYATRANELPKHLEVLQQTPPEAKAFICYPKPGKMDTDLGRDKLWMWMMQQGFQDIRMIPVDDTWAALTFKR